MIPFKNIRVQKSEYGTVTCYCKSHDNRVFGITAAHVLFGTDRKVNLQDIVEVQNIETGRWIKSGLVYKANFSNGFGSFSNWGTIDAGIFMLRKSFIDRIKLNLRPLRISPLLKDDPMALKGEILYSYSSFFNKKIKGKIVKVFYTYGVDSHKNRPEKQRFDILIESLDESQITDSRDSGLLWTDKRGGAVAMHTHGFGNKRFSCSTFIDRIASNFQVGLLYYRD
ncbi:hypothetical protein [Maribacter stanieri]|uniref:hypothetical protein n=1 Tax=Maribacter stanieri TaxID=440514 RepID=UPI002494F3BA|nr:hypothetical protein [Maribacter stanieri]